MAEQTKVEPNVEIPEKGMKRLKYPLHELGISKPVNGGYSGPSFFVPCDDEYQHTVRSTIYSAAKRLGIKVTLRRVFEKNDDYPDGEWGMRVWRVDDNTHETANEDYKQVQPARADGAGGRE